MEIKEVLRRWVGGTGCKQIGARLGLDAKTVRRYVHAAQALGLTRTSDESALSEERLTALLASLCTHAGHPRGDAWERSQAHRDRIKQLLAQGLRLSKLRKLLQDLAAPRGHPCERVLRPSGIDAVRQLGAADRIDSCAVKVNLID